MIVSDIFLKKLRSAFNLNIYEAKIWTALLSRGVASASELADIGNVPRSRAYDILESLEKKGFVIVKLGKPIKYIGIKPEEVFEREKKKIMEKAKNQAESLENIKQTNLFKDLQLLFNQGVEHIDATNISGSLKGRNNIYEQISSMVNNSKKTINIATSEEGLIRKHNKLKEEIKKAHKKGVQIRIIAPVTNKNKDTVKELSKYAKIKNQDLNARFVTTDKAEAIFMTNDDKNVHESYDNAIWISSPFFVNTLNNMFNGMWVKK